MMVLSLRIKIFRSEFINCRFTSPHHAQVSDLFSCKAGSVRPAYPLLDMRKKIRTSQKPNPTAFPQNLVLCVGLHSCKAEAWRSTATCQQKMLRPLDADMGFTHLQMLTFPRATTTKTELKRKRNSEPSFAIPSLGIFPNLKEYLSN